MFTHRLGVRFSDCDALGHVNNAAYFTYCEQARFYHWRALGIDIRPPRPGSLAFILARAECNFEAQATYGDEIEVRLTVSTVGRTSFTYDYEMVNVATGERVATARSVQVCFDYQAQTPLPIPEELRERLEDMRIPSAAPGGPVRPLKSRRRTR